jgi:hypothetical protein
MVGEPLSELLAVIIANAHAFGPRKVTRLLDDRLVSFGSSLETVLRAAIWSGGIRAVSQDPAASQMGLSVQRGWWGQELRRSREKQTNSAA